MKTPARLPCSRLPATFDGLVRLHAPRPIHDQAAYKNTVEIIDALAGHKPNPDQEDFLQVPSGLVERYEADTLPKRAKLSGVDMLRCVLEEDGLRGDDLAKIIGVDRSVAYRLLKGERGLTTGRIQALCDRLGASVDVFIGWKSQPPRPAGAGHSFTMIRPSMYGCGVQ
jgi:HTH-type transcriptional regulator / antitoxin HigA